MTQPATDVLIVGAGPTGLTLAIELRRLGLSARLIDKNAHPAQYSQALVVQARTLEQWERYGIAEQAIAAGRKLHRGHLFSGPRQIVSINFDLIPGKYPYLLFLPQKDTEHILTEHLQSINGAHIERQTELLSFTQTDDTVTSTLRLPDGATETHHSSWILGADGSHSTLRDQLKIPFSGEAVHLNFLLGDLALEGEDLPGDEIVVHLHHGDVVFLGRLTDQLTRVIYASHDDAQAHLPAGQPIPLETFNDAFARNELRLRATASEWSTPFRINDRQAGKYRVGRALIAGDASHIHSPVGGQGMNTGIQDAANLAWKLAAVHRGADFSLLDTYESERMEVGRELLQRTGTALHTATSTNPAVSFFRDHLARAATSLDLVQRTAAGFVSETSIAYRSSPISQDAGQARGGHGSLHPGDRVPNPQVPIPNTPVPKPQVSTPNTPVPNPQASVSNIPVPNPEDLAPNTPAPNLQDLAPNTRVPNPQDLAPNTPVPASTGPTITRDLLDPLSSARTLLLAVNTADLPSDVPASSPHLAILPITTTGHAELTGLFGAEPAYFVIRPDGYLGLRTPATHQAEVLPYLYRIGALDER